MAKQPESDSFMDMFGRFGRDLKVPNVDVEAILAHHRKNLEALEKAARAGAAGATSLLSRQREMLQDTLREVADVAQSYRAPGNPQELMAKQTEFARKSFEAALKNAVPQLARVYVLSWKRYWATVRTCKLYDYANHRWMDFKGRVTAAPLFPDAAPAAG